MQEQREDLIKRLEEDGWRVVEIKTDVAEEWASEIWRVESEWSPKGFGFWLTLFPNSNPTMEEEIYSGIGTSFVYPDEKENAQGKPFLTFGKGWGTRATQFVNDLARLRHDAFVKEMKQ
jgi:hypothetical protein